MRKERISYRVDNFIDENGDKRYFVIAAISEVLCDEYEPMMVVDDYDNEYQEVVKGLKLGFSICNPKDDFDEDLGITIAIGRARANKNYALYATESGYINTKVVDAFLEQEAEYFKRNPESRIAGYKRK